MRWASSRAPRTACGEQQQLLAVGGRVGPQLERDRHDLVAGVERELGGGGGVDAAAHGDERAPRARRDRHGRVLRGRAERAVQRVGGELGGVALRRRQAAERARRSPRPRAARVEERPALDALHDRARRGRSRAAALGVEARLDHAIALDLHRDAHEVATGGAARGTASAGGRAGRPGPRARSDDRRTTALKGNRVPTVAACPQTSRLHGRLAPACRLSVPVVGPATSRWVSSAADHGPTARGLPYRCYSAQHMRPTREQARATVRG